jgi:N-acetylglucosamine-6-sulfatase
MACQPKKINEESAHLRPNIVVILVDDMRWDEFGAAGHNFIKTPNIDRIAREGAYFKNAFATTPLCSPSRACFLTGQYAHTNGIIDNTARNEQSHQLKTFPRLLNEKGYNTAFIGKWHMGNDDTRRPGFDHWVTLKGQGEAIDPSLNINGERQIVKGYVTDILVEHSIDFINQERDQPFLLYLSHKALHPNKKQADDGSSTAVGNGGFTPADRHKGMYADAIYNRRLNNNIPPLDKPALARQIKDLPPLSEKTSTSDQTIRERSEMLMAVDEGLGSILNVLSEKGILDNTIVVFASDHGYWYGEHCLDYERRLAYEEAIRIPLLIRFPPLISAGLEPDQTVLSIDMAPTLIDMAGVSPPSYIQGKSLMPILKNTIQDSWRNAFLIEYYSDIVFPRISHMGYKAVRTDRYKYIQYEELEGMDELYDLSNDPYELKNLINDASKVDELTKMKAELNKLLVDTGAL